MAGPRRGTIPSDGVVNLLRTLDENRASGLLVYRGPKNEIGEIWLRLGQIDTAQGDATAGGQDPVEKFLALRGGTYEILDQLPPLEDTQGTGLARSGSLARHTIADLMNYAEGAALSGLIHLESGTRVAEIVYTEGMLGSIYLDGAANDVDAIFGWSEGTFVIRANTPPSLAPPTGPEPLVLERALGSLLDVAAERRPRPISVAPPKQRTIAPARREATVRIIMLGGGGEALLKVGPRGSTDAPPAEVAEGRETREGSRASVVRPTLPRTSDRRGSRSFASREPEPEPEPIVPRVALALIVLLLLVGIAAFVASLLAIG